MALADSIKSKSTRGSGKRQVCRYRSTHLHLPTYLLLGQRDASTRCIISTLIANLDCGGSDDCTNDYSLPPSLPLSFSLPFYFYFLFIHPMLFLHHFRYFSSAILSTAYRAYICRYVCCLIITMDYYQVVY